jgi:multiphosphoryl transfer protein
MVSIVLVSHSRELALALRNLVNQVAGSEVQIEIAAGVGDEREEFGTDAVEIMEAIQAVYSDEGVLVLMDLGSAVISAELARDLLPPEMAEKIRFCSAPLVEGSIAAAVQAGLGASLEAVCAEARQALRGKEEQLGGAAETEQGAAQGAAHEAAHEAAQTAEGQLSVVVQLKNEHGLHARPAARFVQTAAAFKAEVQVRNLTRGKGPAPARSLNALATLAAMKDHEIEISAKGEQAEEALKALEALVRDDFGEAAAAPAARAPSARAPSAKGRAAPGAVEEEGAQKVVAVSEGAALAPLYVLREEAPAIPEHPAEDVEHEWNLLQGAIEQTRKAIEKQHQEMRRTVGEEEAAIFQAHLLILDDPLLHESARAGIAESGQNAAKAWQEAIEAAAEGYRSLDDAYLQQRAQDVLDVGAQVINDLLGKPDTGTIQLPGEVILFAYDLTPSQTAALDLDKVLGIATVGGGPTSHSAILARAMAIPAVAGASASLEALPAGTRVGLDGFEGKIWVSPGEERTKELDRLREEWLSHRRRLLEDKLEPAATRDGREIEVAANVGSVTDAREAAENGAMGVGLLRTEFLFLRRETPPSEEEQVSALVEIAEALGPLPIILRTLDVGGDKALPYIDLPQEANPFLGVRAIRLSFQRPELFTTQLRAALRAGAKGSLRIMFPMVTNLAEVLQAKGMLEEAHRALEAEGTAHAWPIETGIMVEVPGAAVMSSILAREVDFFSIGTNDLTQYTLAAERGNPNLPGFADALHPAVLRLIEMVVQAAHAEGKWVGVCGELAGDPAAVPVLVGLGVDELSLNPKGIPHVKYILRQLHIEEVQRLAQEVMNTADAAEARRLAAAFFQKLPKS